MTELISALSVILSLGFYLKYVQPQDYAEIKDLFQPKEQPKDSDV